MTTTPPPGHPPAPDPDAPIRARAAVARLLDRVAEAIESPAAADALMGDLAAVLVDLDERPATQAPSVPDLAEVALGALAAAGRGETDGEVQRPTPALPMLRLEDAAGAILQVDADPDGPHYVATMATEVFDEDGEQIVGAVGLDRAHATALRDWLTRLLGDAPPATCGESAAPWHEDEACLLPLGHEGWHKALAATWAPGIPRAEWSAIAADEAASYTWVPTESEQARIDATRAYAGPLTAGESPAEVLAFADELDAERDAAAKEGL